MAPRAEFQRESKVCLHNLRPNCLRHELGDAVEKKVELVARTLLGAPGIAY